MFDSGVPISEILTEVRDEFERMTEYDEPVYASWYNSLISLLYNDLIREQKRVSFDSLKSEIVLSELGENVRKEDVYAVFADGVQLLEVNPFNAETLKDTFYHSDGKIYIYAEDKAYKKVSVVCFVRPMEFVAESEAEQGNVPLPIEFLDLVRYKLRAEACKRTGDNNQLAKWTHEYNYLLENFKVWLSGKLTGFGM